MTERVYKEGGNCNTRKLEVNGWSGTLTNRKKFKGGRFRLTVEILQGIKNTVIALLNKKRTTPY